MTIRVWAIKVCKLYWHVYNNNNNNNNNNDDDDDDDGGNGDDDDDDKSENGMYYMITYNVIAVIINLFYRLYKEIFVSQINRN